MTLTDKDEAGKLFVGGLSWETTKEKLNEYFSRYGEVVDSVVMKNVATGRSRGFGFVTFADPSVLELVLSAGPHKLDGKTIDPKSCTPRSQQKNRGDVVGKLFLGGLPPDITETELRDVFSKFGKVTEVNIMYDQEKRKSRGFGFLSFESEDATHQACLEHYVDVNGKQIECKRAVPRDSSRRGPHPSHGGQSYGGGGGGHSSSWNRMGPPQQNWGQMPPMNAPPPSYMGNWAAPQAQQQAYAANGSAVGSYPPSYQGYSAMPSTASYAAYNSSAPASYGQANYAGYSTEQVAPSAGTTAPLTSYAGSGATSTDYSAAPGYAAAAGGQPVRSYSQQQPQAAYHPYRR